MPRWAPPAFTAAQPGSALLWQARRSSVATPSSRQLALMVNSAYAGASQLFRRLIASEAPNRCGRPAELLRVLRTALHRKSSAFIRRYVYGRDSGSYALSRGAAPVRRRHRVEA